MPEKGCFRRMVSASERFWLAFEEEGMPMSVALGMDGTGDIPDEQMKRALCILADKYPVCRSRLKGSLSRMRWEESQSEIPFVRIGPEELKAKLGDWPLEIEKKILRSKMDLRKENPVSVYSLRDGIINRLYLRIHHACMDGLSVFLMAEELFRILRGEDPLGPSEGPETRDELYALKLPHDYFQKSAALPTKESPAIEPRKGNASILFPGLDIGRHLIGMPSKIDCIQWYRLFIPWERMSSRSLNGKVLYAILEAFYELYPEIRNKKVFSSMAVDLRTLLMPGLRKASNLTGLIMIEPSRYSGMLLPERIKAIQKDVRESIDKGLAYRKYPAYTNFIPVWLFRMGIHVMRKLVFNRKIFPLYYPFTSVGRFNLADLSMDTFKAARAWPFGILQIGYPLFSLITTHDSGIEITLMTDTDDRKGFERFIDVLRGKIDWAEKTIQSGL